MSATTISTEQYSSYKTCLQYQNLQYYVTSFLLSDTCSIYEERVVWWWKSIDLENLRDLHDLRPFEHENVACLSIYMHVGMYVRLASAWTVRRNLLIFGIQEIILHTLGRWLVNINICSARNRGPSNGPKDTSLNTARTHYNRNPGNIKITHAIT
jgi:hypothetical protein